MATPNEIDVGPIGPTGPTPESIDLSKPLFDAEVAQTNLKSPPSGHISVINPNGEEGHVPIDWLLKEGIKKGYSLPVGDDSNEISEFDITPEKEVKVIRKSDGSGGTVPLDWYLKDPKAKDYILESKADVNSIKEYNKQLEDYTKVLKDPIKYRIDQDLNVVEGAKYSPEEGKKSLEKVIDQDGNYKMLSPKGEVLSVPKDSVMGLLASGANFKFQDSKFQAMFDAQIRNQEASETAEAASALSGIAKSLPFISGLQKSDIHDVESAKDLSANLASTFLKDTKYKKAEHYGEIGGTVAQILSPTGLFGEVKLAQAAKAGIAAKLAPEGASFLRTLGAKTLGGITEGAILATPQAIAQVAINDNPKAAAESLGIGAGIGLLLGGGGTLLSKGADLGVDALNKGKDLLKPALASRFSKTATGTTTKDLLTKEALAAETAGDISSLLVGEKAAERAGRSVADDTFAKHISQTLGKSSDGNQIKNSFRKVMEGERLDDFIKDMDNFSEGIRDIALQSDNILDSRAVVDSIKKEIRQAIPEMQSLGIGGNAAKSKELSKLADSLGEKFIGLSDDSGYLALKDIKKFVGELGDEINWKSKDLSAQDQVKSIFWSAGIKELKNNIDSLTKYAADPEIISKWSLESELLSKSAKAFNQAILLPQHELNPFIKGVLNLATDKLTGTVAGSLGGPVGAVAGGMAADVVNKGIKNIETSFIERYAGSDSKIGKFLIKNKVSNDIGSYAAIDAVKNMDSKISKIPAFIKDLGGVLKTGAIKAPPSFIPEQEPIKSILGPESNGLSKAQQFDKLSNKLSTMASDSTLLKQQFDLKIAPLFKEYPELQTQLYKDYEQKIQSLNKIVNMYNTKEPAAFSGKPKKYEPTYSQMKEIEGLLKVANNPYAILDGLANGKVTAKQVSLVAELNPAILQKVRDELSKEAYSGKSKLSYQQKMSASIIMGQPMDPSLKNGAALQAVYGGNAPAPQSNQPPPRKQGNSRPLKANKISSYTTAQRISKL